MFSVTDKKLLPSLQALDDVKIDVIGEGDISEETVTNYLVSAKENTDTGGAVGILVTSEGDVPAFLGLSREGLKSSGFEGKVGDVLPIPTNNGLMVAVGFNANGASDADSENELVNALRSASAAFARAAAKREGIALVLPKGVEFGADEAAAVIEGALLARNRYTIFKSEKPEDEVALASITLVVPAGMEEKVQAGVELGKVSSRATLIARDLTNAPPADLTPADLANYAVDLAEAYGFEATVMKRKDLKKMGCGGILGVNRGSKRPPRLIKLVYRPEGGEDAKRLTMVGKGVTFDSGGLSLKPSDAMIEMKMDMGGAAAVIGAFSALRDLGVTLNVDAYIPSTDNMISGDAFRLGEVLVARNGKTVEVKNTDAEGRLILMDALSLAAEDQPDWIVDVATLTGAAMVSLGADIAALFGTNHYLNEMVEKAAAATGEEVWEMPLHASYQKLLKSSVADLQNIGSRWGGAITAALFLQNFVGDVPWAHLDIAGPMSSEKDHDWVNAGATGFGARLLAALAADLSEQDA